MKYEQYRSSPLQPKDRISSPSGPCMRGKIDIDHYNLTGEVRYIEALEEFVPPPSDPFAADSFVINPVKAPPQNFKRKRGKVMVHPNKPTAGQLEADMSAGMSITQLVEKYEVHQSTIFNWIKGYKLPGFKERAKAAGVVNAPDLFQESPAIEDEPEQISPEDEIQESPSDEITEPGVEDIGEKPWSDAEAEHYPEPEDVPQPGKCQDDPEVIEPDDSTPEPFENAWRNVGENLRALKGMYRIEADKAFSSKLRDMFDSIIDE